jgi:carbon monoxide dehydrogenase subunit G
VTTQIVEVAVIPAPVARVWEVLQATNRYAEWVAVVREVTEHHGTAEIGRTYSEVNVVLGPLTTRSTWTVREIEPLRRRVDTGTGFPLVHDLTNTFLLQEVDAGTEMTYQVEYRFGLGRLGRLIDAAQQGGQRAAMRTSMANLAELLHAEGT